MGSNLVRRVPKRAMRFPSLAVDTIGDTRSLVRRVEQRPCPYVIPVIDREDHWRLPSEVLGSGGPTDIYYYLGIVEEVHDDGRVLVTLWQHPGIELISELSVDAHFHGVRPLPLDVIQAWAWTECPGKGVETPRLYARRLPKDDKTKSEALLDEILSILRPIEAS